MALTDFLFQGSPPPSVTTYGETTTNVPAWYNDYTQGLISKANAIAAEPYQPYGQQRIAGLDYAQNQAYDKALGLEQTYSPLMQGAETAITGAQGSALSTAQPYINQALQYNPYTTAQPTLDEAGGLLRQQVGDTSALAQPYFQQASNLTGQAAQTGLGNIQDYLNPYTDQVVNRIGD
jgi:hypothetical protein